MTKRRVLTFLLAGLLVFCAGGPVLPRAAGAEPASGELPMGDGLMRNSLSNFAAPEAAPAVEPVPVPAPAPVVRSRARARVLAPHRRVHGQAAHNSIRVVKRERARRNPLESFVYWWNGWVIRTFHTTEGTVLLQRIGARA